MKQQPIRDWMDPADFDAPGQRPSIRLIQHTVAEYYGLSVSDLTGKQRHRRYARPRQIAMHLCAMLTENSLPAIGRKFGNLHHATVIHARNRIGRLCVIEPPVGADVARVRKRIKAKQEAV